VRVSPVLTLVGALIALIMLSCSSLTTENKFASPDPATISTGTPLFYASTSTVTPPIIEFPDLNPGEAPAIVRGVINSSDPTLNIYAGPGSDFPVLADLNNKTMIDVIGKSQDGWLFISDSYPDSELRGWVEATYILMEQADVPKIGFVQIVTATMPPFLP
jgi:uncharacterized protein YgiM (DUF1202 family)